GRSRRSGNVPLAQRSDPAEPSRQLYHSWISRGGRLRDGACAGRPDCRSGPPRAVCGGRWRIRLHHGGARYHGPASLAHRRGEHEQPQLGGFAALPGNRLGRRAGHGHAPLRCPLSRRRHGARLPCPTRDTYRGAAPCPESRVRQRQTCLPQRGDRLGSVATRASPANGTSLLGGEESDRQLARRGGGASVAGASDSRRALASSRIFTASPLSCSVTPAINSLSCSTLVALAIGAVTPLASNHASDTCAGVACSSRATRSSAPRMRLPRSLSMSFTR